MWPQVPGCLRQEASVSNRVQSCISPKNQPFRPRLQLGKKKTYVHAWPRAQCKVRRRNWGGCLRGWRGDRSGDRGRGGPFTAGGPVWPEQQGCRLCSARCSLHKGPAAGGPGPSLPSALFAAALTGGRVRLEEGVPGPHLLQGTLGFGDGLKGDLGRPGLTWTRSCCCWGTAGCPSRRWCPAVWMGGRSLHEERLLHEERSPRTERFLCLGRFPRARTGRSPWTERPRPLSSPAWLW